MVGARSRARVAAGILFGLAAAEVATAIVFGFLSPLGWAELVDLLVVSTGVRRLVTQATAMTARTNPTRNGNPSHMITSYSCRCAAMSPTVSAIGASPSKGLST